MLRDATATERGGHTTVEVFVDCKTCQVTQQLPTGSGFTQAFGGPNDGICWYDPAISKDECSARLVGKFHRTKPHGMMKLVRFPIFQFVPYKYGVKNGKGLAWDYRGGDAWRTHWKHGKCIRRIPFAMSETNLLFLKDLQPGVFWRYKGFTVTSELDANDVLSFKIAPLFK